MIQSVIDGLKKKYLTCPHCGQTDQNVISYYAHVGGDAAPQRITGCTNISDCLERQRQRDFEWQQATGRAR